MDKMLTIKQVASALGVSHDTVTRWVNSGKVKARRGRLFAGKTSPILISPSELERLKKMQNVSAKS